VAVPQDDRWGRSYEGYSESPDVVASYAAAMVEGLQGKVGTPEFLDGRHVMVSVKHFLGDGGTTGGKDQGDTALTEAELVRIHGAGYPPAIAAGAQAVMASYNSVNGTKMHGNEALLTGALKGRMHFGGFVVGDWNGHGQIPGCSATDCPATFNAGLDMAMAPDSWKGMVESTLAAVKAGTIPAARLDDAVRRILRVKFRLGLFDAGRPSQRTVGGQLELLGAPDHRAVARQAVRESLVLLKNQNALLPLAPDQHVLVAGDGADDVGKQAGGWTLSWQGGGNVRDDFPNADSIYEGLARQIGAAGGTATLAVDGRYTQKPDVAIVVFGENPYAEFQGDLPNLLYKPGDETDLELIRRLKADGIPVVAVFLSGRPLWVNREINAADAFVAAWLPGSEGEGIADVLLRSAAGAVQHDFRGKLSFSWPRTAVQYANNVGQAGYDPQFAFGFGLTYGDNGDLAPLPEDAGISLDGGASGVYYARGETAAGIALRLEGADGTGVAVTTLPAALPGDLLRVTAIDHEAQEDARRLQWSGAGEAAAALQSHTSFDLLRESNGDILVLTTLRVDAPATGEVWLQAGCGAGCSGRVDIGPSLAKLTTGTWVRVGVPLKCLAKAGTDVTRLDRPWSIATSGSLTLSVSKVALGGFDAAEELVDCAR
jgi:beta-glucosidase